jgi:hypothetical protein
MVKIWNRSQGKAPKGTKYCGRPISQFNPFGNPFVIHLDGDRNECVRKHKAWLETGESFGNRTASEELRAQVLAKLPELKGKDLECWCSPKACHCDTLAELANKE